MKKQATHDKTKAKARSSESSDAVDESSDESFPASDAPTSWAGRDIPPDERKTPN